MVQPCLLACTASIAPSWVSLASQITMVTLPSLPELSTAIRAKACKDIVLVGLRSRLEVWYITEVTVEGLQ